MQPLTPRYPTDDTLLTRAAWRAAVLDRDAHRCVLCGAPADQVHHIIERRLFEDGGYYVENGATLCGVDQQNCHKKAETTRVTCEDVRAAAGITTVLYPTTLSLGDVIDKWGNAIVEGAVEPGPLYWDTGAARARATATPSTTRFKHPRTPHLPWSPGAQGDDVMLKDMSRLEGKEVVVTAKLDGECTVIGRDEREGYCHARSLDSGSHPSRTWVRALAGHLAGQLPLGWRVVGENVQARHSVPYKNLPGYFFVFAITTDQGIYLSWDDLCEYAALLDLPTVPVLYRGMYNEGDIRNCWPGSDPYADDQDKAGEGYVIRLADPFPSSEFATSVAKFVRPNHVTSSTHWRHEQMVENKLTPPFV